MSVKLYTHHAMIELMRTRYLEGAREVVDHIMRHAITASLWDMLWESHGTVCAQLITAHSLCPSAP